MTTPEQLTEIVHASLEEIDFGPERSPETVIFGPGGKLDSLGLVQLIVAIEQELGESFDVDLTLADERALSEARSPFRTLGSLIEFVGRRMQEESGG